MIKSKSLILAATLALLVCCNGLTGEACNAARDFLRQKAVTPDSVKINAFEELDQRDGVTAAWMEWDQRNAYNAEIRQRGLVFVDVTHRVILNSDECRFLEINRPEQVKALYGSNEAFRRFVDAGFNLAVLERRLAFPGKK